MIKYGARRYQRALDLLLAVTFTAVLASQGWRDGKGPRLGDMYLVIPVSPLLLICGPI